MVKLKLFNTSERVEQRGTRPGYGHRVSYHGNRASIYLSVIGYRGVKLWF